MKKCTLKVKNLIFILQITQFIYNLLVAFISTLFSLKIRKKGRKIVSNILNSLLVPVLNPKSTTFSHLVPVQNSKKKIQKSFFFGYLSRSKYLIFGLKKFLKNFEAAFGTQYYLQKIFYVKLW
jgi:hypothetical protein